MPMATIVVRVQTLLHGWYCSAADGALWYGFILSSRHFWLLSIMCSPTGIVENMMLNFPRRIPRDGPRTRLRYLKATDISLLAGLSSWSGDIVSTGGKMICHINILNRQHNGKTQSGSLIRTAASWSITSLSKRKNRNNSLTL